MRPYFYIKGLIVRKKFYNKDKLDFKNIREGNYFTDYYAALAELNDIEDMLETMQNM